MELRDTIRSWRRISATYQRRKALEFVREKAGRGFIVEAQFNGAPGHYHHHQGWTILMDPPPFAKEELVREFYGNYSEAPGDFVYVRGVNVDMR